ncbi:MAG: anion permease, partial [Caldilineaceae bacterium]|nr:anion permease [Caldilineaceae bacterium]
EEMGNRLYITEVIVLPNSPLIGKTLTEAGLGHDLDITVLRIIFRDPPSADRYSVTPTARRLTPRQGRHLRAGDILQVEGEREALLNSKATMGLELREDLQKNTPEVEPESLQLVEVLILPRSPLIGETLTRHRFRERYGIQVLAIYRHGETLQRKLSQVPLQVGDVLLLQGEREQLRTLPTLEEQEIFHVLNAVHEEAYQWNKAPIAIVAFVAALAAVGLNLLALPVAVLLAVLVVFLTRCISVEEAYRRVEWRALVLIGSMLALGVAMEQTGTAMYLADQIVRWSANADPRWLLTAFFVLAVVLTQPMSNQASAIVVVPIALQTATQLELNPRTFAMMIAIAASTSYLTPLEPSCLMVYGPGNYRFADFLKVGSLLTLVVYGIAILLVPYFWPL